MTMVAHRFWLVHRGPALVPSDIPAEMARPLLQLQIDVDYTTSYPHMGSCLSDRWSCDLGPSACSRVTESSSRVQLKPGTNGKTFGNRTVDSQSS